MAEREYDDTQTGDGGGGGDAAWLTDPTATPPAAPPGFRYVFTSGRWQLQRITAPADTASPPSGPMTREQRDVLQRGTLGNLEGFMGRESYGTDLKARNSVKNTFATIASRYPSKPSSLDKILADPDFQRLFPNARKVSADSIDFGGVLSDFESGTPVGIIDVLTAADPNTDTARGWWWGYNAAGAGPTTFRPTTAGAFSSMSSGSPPSGSGTASSPYDWSRYGTEALSKSPEARGWSTLAELGMTGERVNETPEDIFRRNQGTGDGQFGTSSNPGWQSNPAFSNPGAAGQFQGAPRGLSAPQAAGMFASGWAAPVMSLATLGRGLANVFGAPRGRKVSGRL